MPGASSAYWRQGRGSAGDAICQVGWARRPTRNILRTNPSSGGHRRTSTIAYRGIVRSSSGVDPTARPALVGERPLATQASAVTMNELAADPLPPEDDDQLRWFVDLFVAEYSSEA